MSVSAASPAPPPWRVIAVVAALAFLVLFEYALVRGPVDSLFVERHGSGGLPEMWLVVAVFVALVVFVYNRLATRFSLTQLLLGATAVSAVLLAMLATLAGRGVPGSTVALYAWKDVHVVVLVEILWTFANASLKLRTARWVYGLFCAIGSIGGITGNMLAGEVAARVGTESALWLALPAFAAIAIAGALCGRWLAPPAVTRETSSGDGRGGLALLGRSRYLLLLFALVAIVQIFTTLIDFTFLTAAESAYPDLDQRSQMVSRVYGAIDATALVLQLLAVPLLGLVGVAPVLLAIPVVLGGSLIAFLIAPGFATMAVAKVANKASTYSLFRAGKELLYLPLSYRDKTQGKAVIDMFGYRVAKGGASVALIIGAAAAVGSALVLAAAWFAVTWSLLRRYRSRLAASDSEREDDAGADVEPAAVAVAVVVGEDLGEAKEDVES